MHSEIPRPEVRGLQLRRESCKQTQGRAGVGHPLCARDNTEKVQPEQRGGRGGNALSFDPQLIKPLKTRSGDMSVKDVTEVGEECGLLSGPRTQRPICVHVGTPDPGWISCSCFLLRHHNTTTELQSALLAPHPRRARQWDFCPLGACRAQPGTPVSRPSWLLASLECQQPASPCPHLLPSLVFSFSHPPQHTCEWQIQSDLDPTDRQGAKPGRLRENQLGCGQPWHWGMLSSGSRVAAALVPNPEP